MWKWCGFKKKPKLDEDYEKWLNEKNAEDKEHKKLLGVGQRVWGTAGHKKGRRSFDQIMTWAGSTHKTSCAFLYSKFVDADKGQKGELTETDFVKAFECKGNPWAQLVFMVFAYHDEAIGFREFVYGLHRLSQEVRFLFSLFDPPDTGSASRKEVLQSLEGVLERTFAFIRDETEVLGGLNAVLAEATRKYNARIAKEEERRQRLGTMKRDTGPDPEAEDIDDRQASIKAKEDYLKRTKDLIPRLKALIEDVRSKAPPSIVIQDFRIIYHNHPQVFVPALEIWATVHIYSEAANTMLEGMQGRGTFSLLTESLEDPDALHDPSPAALLARQAGARGQQLLSQAAKLREALNPPEWDLKRVERERLPALAVGLKSDDPPDTTPRLPPLPSASPRGLASPRGAPPSPRPPGTPRSPPKARQGKDGAKFDKSRIAKYSTLGGGYQLAADIIQSNIEAQKPKPKMPPIGFQAGAAGEAEGEGGELGKYTGARQGHLVARPPEDRPEGQGAHPSPRHRKLRKGALASHFNGGQSKGLTATSGGAWYGKMGAKPLGTRSGEPRMAEAWDPEEDSHSEKKEEKKEVWEEDVKSDEVDNAIVYKQRGINQMIAEEQIRKLSIGHVPDVATQRRHGEMFRRTKQAHVHGTLYDQMKAQLDLRLQLRLNNTREEIRRNKLRKKFEAIVNKPTIFDRAKGVMGEQTERWGAQFKQYWLSWYDLVREH